MNANQTVCDACKKPIDPSAGKVSFVPLRGGLTLVVSDGKNNAGCVIDHPMDFCDETCLAEFAKGIREKIITPPADK